MQLRDSLQKKGKKFFNKTLHSLKHCLLFDGFRKLPRPSYLHPFSCASWREQGVKGDSRTEDSYPGFPGKRAGTEEAKEVEEEDEEAGGSISIGKKVSTVPKEEEGEQLEKVKVGNSCHSTSFRGGGEEGGFALSKKMKELGMVELRDMEHVLDVEEALHYYSRLTSPVYVGIVDKFFLDMYSDFSRSPARQAPSLLGRNLGQRRTASRALR
ncbi:uncharacterized protein LOC116200696 [Punica granatum]|uniref:OVATE domain-containing protein n=2 Tax=Punica granatum TaxID=22663 RepID=A0A218WVE8_PUNGR|nr:uncharacterized protein LOC116200696 [Punica granatum]OWM76479.1 hypothetical protein CDL15_Pgr005443 [Punica granatum]PKI71047.1 hypothetical protein CRG98_008628 [Punica granatum]